MSLLEELCHLGVGLEGSKAHSRAILTLWVDQEVNKALNYHASITMSARVLPYSPPRWTTILKL